MTNIVRYKLTVSLTLTKEIGTDSTGRPVDAFEPDAVSKVDYWRSDGSGERLSINEDVTLGALDFMGAMGVLGQLHEAMQAIRPAG